MRRLKKLLLVPGQSGLLRIGILAASLTLGAGLAWAQPANDNFSSAQDIGPTLSGTVFGDNLGATVEAGESATIPVLQGEIIYDQPVGASTWYLWTAPSSGTIQFDTIGSDFDTVLAIYTGSDVSSLTLVASDDNSGDAINNTSSLTFYAVIGTHYYIRVNGNNNFPPAAQGNVVLNWNGQPVGFAGGTFRFTATNYVFSQTESIKSESGAMDYTRGARISVTRVGGSTGRMLVHYTVGDVSLPTFYLTNVDASADVHLQEITTNVPPSVVAFTNIFLTNYTVFRVTGDPYPRNFDGQPPTGYLYFYLPLLFYATSNEDANGIFAPPVTYFGGVGIPPTTSSNGIALPNGDVLVATTNVPVIFNTNGVFLPGPNVVGAVAFDPAHPNNPYDYVAQSGFLTFNDFEMTKDILISVTNKLITRPGGNLNPEIIATLDYVIPDPAESIDIPLPLIDTTRSTARVDILNYFTLPPLVLAIGNLFPTNFSLAFGSSQFLLLTNGNLMNFERSTLRCREGIGNARIAVRRESIDGQQCTMHYRMNHRRDDDDYNTFPLQSGSEYATPDNATKNSGTIDFTNVIGQLQFGGNQFTASFDVPIIDDTEPEFNEDFVIQFYADQQHQWNNCFPGQVVDCTVTILYDDEPAGAADRTWNLDNNSGTTPPNNAHPGALGNVFAVAVQPADGKSIIAGDFSTYNQTPRHGIARANVDGQIDATFNPGTGLGGSPGSEFINAAMVDNAGKIVIAGNFSSFNATLRNSIARLNSNGSVDGTFNPGLGISLGSGRGTVWSALIQPDGKILVAGQFDTYNGVTRNYIARVNTDGSLDSSFDPGTSVLNEFSPSGTSIEGIALQSDGKIVIGGNFTQVDGVPRNNIARLNADGTFDASFDPGSGANGIVYAVAVQSDGEILAGGSFTQLGLFGGTPSQGIARLNPDGSVDGTFNAGSGADDVVYNITLQPDGGILLGGVFTHINETRRISLARLLPSGALDTSFMDTAYNQFAGLINPYFDPNLNPPNPIFSMALQSDGNIMIGGRFSQVGGGSSRSDIKQRSNVARIIGGSTPGPGNIELAFDNYTADAGNAQTNTAFSLTVNRINGNLGPASATVQADPLPPGPGAATYGIDYVFSSATPQWGINWADNWMRSDGQSGSDFSTKINVLSNANPNTALNLRVTSPNGSDIFFLGGFGRDTSKGLFDPKYVKQDGENIPLGVALGRKAANLQILHNNVHPGYLGFATPVYTVSENGTNAVITVTRTNGTDGPVSVLYTTANGPSPNGATNGVDYTTSSNRLSFGSGVSSMTFTVPIRDNTTAQPDRIVKLKLFTPAGGAFLGLTNADLVIVDNDFAPGHAGFSLPTYSTNEDSGAALITVSRLGGSVGTLGVTFSTANGTAINGTNYIGVTTNLSWSPGDITPKVVPIQVMRDGNVTGTLAMTNRLSNPTVNSTNQPLALTGAFTNATLLINNVDALGAVHFSTVTYVARENAGSAIIPIVRSGGSAQSIQVTFSTLGGTAVAGIDYVATNGTLIFGPGELSKSFRVQLLDNPDQDPARFIGLVISNAVPTNGLGFPSTAVLNITDDETVNEPPGQADTTYDTAAGFNDSVFTLALQSDGKLVAGGDFTSANGVGRNRIARLRADGSLDSQFSSFLSSQGANATVRSLIVQTDGRILVGGAFTSFNSVANNHVARLNFNGSLDSSFNAGAGTDNPVYAVGEKFVGSSRRLLLGGAFTLVNGTIRNAIAQLNDDGSVDTSFNPGSGANGTVYALGVQDDGKVIIGGDFTSVNGIPRNHIARLNVNGSVDTTFSSGAGANDSVRALVVQFDGRVVIGGLFTNVNGIALNHVARLNTDGSVDGSFIPGVGANDNVDTIVLQPDTRILLGGDFTRCNDVTRNRVTRLNPDGSVDPSINFGLGADGFVAAMAVQTDSKIILGGGFTHYDGGAHSRIVRIYGGSMAGSGELSFTAANYTADETSTNVVVSIRRTGGTAGPNADGSGDIHATFATSNFTAVAGINFSNTVADLVFAPGEVFQSVTIPLVQDFVVTPPLVANLVLTNLTPPVILGGVPSATLTILNDDSAVSFSSDTYSRAKNAPDGVATINIIRIGSTNGTSTVDFFTTTNGTAVTNLDYLSVSNEVTFAPGQTNASVTIPIVNNGIPEGNRTVTMLLSNAVGSLLFSPFAATLTIIDTVQAPGTLVFSQTNYFANEGTTNAVITVLRTNGSSGTVSVGFNTVAGTAIPGVRYISTNGTLTFGNGETSKAFLVHLIDDSIAEGPQTVSLILTNASGGAVLGSPTTVPLTILDNDISLSFSSAAYVANETNGVVVLNVLRLNDTNNISSVNYATTNGSALATTNFVPASGILTFNPGETNKTLNISVLHDPRVTGDLSFGVTLSNPTNGQLVFPSVAQVIVLDAEAGFNFTNSTLTVGENATNAVIAVVCSNPNVEPISVHFATADGTAAAGVDYTSTSGTLTFTNGQTTNFVLVPIIDNVRVDGNRSFSMNLFSPAVPGQVVSPSNIVVTIVDNDSGLAFSSPTYLVLKSGVAANIGVIRTGFTDSIVSVNFATFDGTATNGQDYVGVNGTLTFTNGQTSTNFSVPVIDSTTVKPDRTVLLQLSNPSPTTNATLVTPSAAVLTIHDTSGSLVVPAGTALLSESGPANGIIDPGENVSLLFALRNSAGTNTANLTATLLTTNGITSPSPSGPQSYGALVVNGPSVSRPFSFTANGTNGQQVIATFQLMDGANDRGVALFTFTLGTFSSSFSNTALIVINDTNSASPYPATINVTGVGGSLRKLTATFDKLKHTAPGDIDALLLSPVGKKSFLMAHAGGVSNVNNVTLTFDDTAASLPNTGQIVSGTNKPTVFGSVMPFPAPAPPAPYVTNLTTFSNSNPNGVWSLFIQDDHFQDSGAISNGWSLHLTTASPIAGDADLLVSVDTAPVPVVVSNNLTYTIHVTNAGPATATGVTLTNLLPAGVNLISVAPDAGSFTSNSTQVVWTLGTLVKDAAATLSITVQPTAAGTITNVSTVLAVESDPNPANNSVTTITTVNTATADLVIGLTGAPSPLSLGGNLTYTLYVTNLGPATATGVVVTNTLPPTATNVISVSSGYVRVGNIIALTNLGSLTLGAQTSATIVVRPIYAGTLTNVAAVASLNVPDPLKGNNSATIKTIVQAPPMTVSQNGANVVIAWPGDATNYVLECATNLYPPFWTQVTNPPPSLINGQNVVTIGAGPGNKYFRLRTQLP